MTQLRLLTGRMGARLLAMLVIGVIAGLLVGGAVHLFGSAGNGAQAAARKPAPSPARITSAAALAEGRVIADAGAGALSTEIVLGRTRSLDGAAAAFTSYAEWLIGSPAAAEAPADAVGVVGGSLMNPADAQVLADIRRTPGDGFTAADGAYRILGHAGGTEAPTEVMVEVTAPLTLAGSTRWSIVGGVVDWTASGWQLVSIEPKDVAQPGPTRSDVHSFTSAERARTLRGLGWMSFAQNRARVGAR